MTEKFNELYNEIMDNAVSKETLLEYKKYQQIPGTKRSFRKDSANFNTKTQEHLHVYSKLNSKGKEVYSVNQDGSGHDGSSGIKIPQKHADYFRSEGFQIPKDNILESITPEVAESNGFTFAIFLSESNSELLLEEEEL